MTIWEAQGPGRSYYSSSCSNDWSEEGVLHLPLPPPHCVTLGSSLWLFLGLKPSGLCTSITSSALLGLHLVSTADLGTFQPPKSCEPIPSNKSIYPIGSTSLENSNILKLQVDWNKHPINGAHSDY